MHICGVLVSKLILFGLKSLLSCFGYVRTGTAVTQTWDNTGRLAGFTTELEEPSFFELASPSSDGLLGCIVRHASELEVNKLGTAA